MVKRSGQLWSKRQCTSDRDNASKCIVFSYLIFRLTTLLTIDNGTIFRKQQEHKQEIEQSKTIWWRKMVCDEFWHIITSVIDRTTSHSYPAWWMIKERPLRSLLSIRQTSLFLRYCTMGCTWSDGKEARDLRFLLKGPSFRFMPSV